MKNYIAAGFDPARFWEITPRLYTLEMDGAADRMKREKSMIWWGAMMPHMKKPPTFEDFTGFKTKAARSDWEAELSAWETYAAQKH